MITLKVCIRILPLFGFRRKSTFVLFFHLRLFPLIGNIVSGCQLQIHKEQMKNVIHIYLVLEDTAYISYDIQFEYKKCVQLFLPQIGNLCTRSDCVHFGSSATAPCGHLDLHLNWPSEYCSEFVDPSGL